METRSGLSISKPTSWLKSCALTTAVLAPCLPIRSDCIRYPVLGKRVFLSRLLRWLEAEDVIAVDMEVREAMVRWEAEVVQRVGQGRVGSGREGVGSCKWDLVKDWWGSGTGGRGARQIPVHLWLEEG